MKSVKKLNFEEIIKRIRKEIREAYKGHKVSVKQQYYGKITIDIDNGDRSNNELLDKAREIIHKYRYDNSDIMTDYFDTNFYYTINGTI